MSNNINNNDWLDALKQKAQDATREVPEGTWEAIAKSVAKQAAPAPAARVTPRLWWKAAAAAVVAIVATTGFFLLNNKSDGTGNMLASDTKGDDTPSVVSDPPASQNPDIADEPLLAQDNSTQPHQSQPSLPPVYDRAPRHDYKEGNTQHSTADETDEINNELLAANFNEPIDLADYPNEFDPENYYYDIETMLALEELYNQYDNAMNQDAMEPWKSYTDSTYQQYLVYDANARRAAREKMELTKPGKKNTMLMTAYGNGLVSTDRNSTVSGSSAQMLLPAATTPPQGMMMAPAAPGMSPSVAPPVNYDYHHHMPLTFGITFNKRIVGNLYGNVGLNFTSMTSDVTPDNGGDMFKQDIKLIGLPFGVRWNFWRYKGLTTFVGGEGMVERVVDASFGKDDVTIKRLQWSAHATAGMQYNFSKHVGVYIEPKLSHYITTMPLNTLRNEHPFNFNLQMGLSVDF